MSGLWLVQVKLRLHLTWAIWMGRGKTDDHGINML